MYDPTTCPTPCRTHPLCVCTTLERQRALEERVKALEAENEMLVSLAELTGAWQRVVDERLTALETETGLRRADEPATERDEPEDGEGAL